MPAHTKGKRRTRDKVGKGDAGEQDPRQVT